jgi:hypothetical protein
MLPETSMDNEPVSDPRFEGASDPSCGRVSRRTALAALSAVFTATLAACGGGEDRTRAQLRFVNASADAALDLTIDGERRFSAVPYGVDPGRTEVDPRRTDSIITRPGSAATLLSLNLALDKDRRYTLLAWGAIGALQTALIGEDDGRPADNTADLRWLNAVPDGDALDVYLTGADDSLVAAVPVLGNVASGTLGAAVNVVSGTWRLRVTAAGSKTDVRLDQPGVQIDSRQVATFVFTPAGSAAPLSGGMLLNTLVLNQQGAVGRIDTPLARVRAVAGLPDSGTVFIELNGTVMANQIGSPAVGPYSLFDSGPGDLVVGINGGGAPAVVDDPVLAAGGDYTLLVFSPTGTSWAWLTDDNRRSIDPAAARIRLVHGVADLAEPLAMSVDFGPVAVGVARGTASGYAEVQSTATASLRVTVAGVSAPVYSIVDQALVAGAVYTVFVVGSADAPVGILRKDR